MALEAAGPGVIFVHKWHSNMHFIIAVVGQRYGVDAIWYDMGIFLV